MFDTPILYLVFNRPDLTEISFERIREIKPRYLFVAADGPRQGRKDDEEKCAAAREVVLGMIDWDCEVKTLLRADNLGCGKAVSEAIDWFFGQVEAGIIMEDDIVANQGFFEFCQEALALHSDDENVMMITGLNVAETWKPKKQSYFYSYFAGIWGWATWRRAWEKYDFDLKGWAQTNPEAVLSPYFNKKQLVARVELYEKLYNKEIDTWDYQWTYCRLVHQGMSIVPTRNMIQNIGIGDDSTHTKLRHPWSAIPVYEAKLPLTRNVKVSADGIYDQLHLGLVGCSAIEKAYLRMMSFVFRHLL